MITRGVCGIGRIGQGIAVVLMLLAWVGTALAQMPVTPDMLESDSGSQALSLEDIPRPLTPETVRDLVARLNDAEVRSLLLERLDAVAANEAVTEAEEDIDSLLGTIETLAEKFWVSLSGTIAKGPIVPGALYERFQVLLNSGGDGFFFVFVGVIALALAIGGAAERAADFVARKVRQRIADASVETLRQRIAILALRIGLDFVGLFAFVIAASVVIFAFFGSGTPARFTAMGILLVIASVRLTGMIVRIPLSPQRADLRLCSTDDQTARYLMRQFMIIAGVMSFGYVSVAWSWRMGLAPGEIGYGFWVSLVIHATVSWTLWHAREGLTGILIGDDAELSDGGRRFARLWPRLAIFLTWIEWLAIEIIINTGNGHLFSPTAALATLILIIMVPMLDTMLRAIVRNAYPLHRPVSDADEQPETVGDVEMRRETQRGLIRMGRVMLCGVLVVLLTGMWGIDMTALAEQGLGARIAGSAIEAVLIVTLAYVAWEFSHIIINRRLALEMPAAADAHAEPGGEGGGAGGSRLGTLLPLIRRAAEVTIVLMAALAILSELGINIAPLLAGAGIIGLAIGFGAQTLVRDIVSGLFFLIDDAFRIGEYIDVGGTMGTVEKISIRSLRLRHQNGPVHTVPYGEITKLTNYSRDWVVVKLKFRVPFETDIAVVKKIFKQIGKDMLADPDIGPDFIQPFKSQGVFDVDDSGIVVRGKFMAKPGTQFMIKREVFVRVQRAFEEAGIEFARRQVMVSIPRADQLDHEDRKAVEDAAAAAAERALEDDEAAARKGPTPEPAGA